MAVPILGFLGIGILGRTLLKRAAVGTATIVAGDFASKKIIGEGFSDGGLDLGNIGISTTENGTKFLLYVDIPLPFLNGPSVQDLFPSKNPAFWETVGLKVQWRVGLEFENFEDLYKGNPSRDFSGFDIGFDPGVSIEIGAFGDGAGFININTLYATGTILQTEAERSEKFASESLLSLAEDSLPVLLDEFQGLGEDILQDSSKIQDLFFKIGDTFSDSSSSFLAPQAVANVHSALAENHDVVKNSLVDQSDLSSEESDNLLNLLYAQVSIDYNETLKKEADTLLSLEDGFYEGESFNNETYFNKGASTPETSTPEDIARDVAQNNTALNMGNAGSTSTTINISGFWSEVNAAFTGWFRLAAQSLAPWLASREVDRIAHTPIDTTGKYTSINWAGLINSSGQVAEIDPIILDLDGDGIELTPFAENQIFFDVDNDRAIERTGWTTGDDGILVRDLNGNGAIDDITETISEYYTAPAGTGMLYDDGFAALKTLDGNNDNRITSADALWGELKVWQDANNDAVTDDGELKSLAQLGISEFSLLSTPDGAFIGGNEVQARSTYRIGSEVHTLAAVNFTADPSGLTATGSGFDLEAGGAVYTAGDGGETVSLSREPATSVIGGNGHDILNGDSGDNWLIGGPGSDRLSGGDGNDYLVADSDDLTRSNPRIRGGNGFDIVQFVGNAGVAFNMQQSTVEMAIGTRFADVLAVGASTQGVINGGAGDDVLIGGSADDALNGENGQDVVYGYDGDDLMRGHRGEDALVGGNGEDLLFGGQDNDVLSGDAGEDLLQGDGGDDTLDGGDDYDVAQYSGSYADYEVRQNSDGSYTVTDQRSGVVVEGQDRLENIEALNFADILEVPLDGENPLPVRDVLRISPESDGRTFQIAVADLLANDLDYQQDTLNITDVFGAVGGSVALNGNTIVFTREAGYQGIPSFSYTIADSQGNSGAIVGLTDGSATAEMTAKVTVLQGDDLEDPLYASQWYLNATNVQPVWADYTGKGVQVGVFEPGPWDAELPGQIDYSHPDLAANINAESLRTQNPNIEPTQHATLVAGVIGAARNEIGGVGVAYDVILSSKGFSIDDLNPLLDWYRYDIANNSWGQEDPFTVTSLVDDLPADDRLLEQAALYGRGGLGTITVFGAGNSRQEGLNTNSQSFTNDRHALVVGAVNAEQDLGNLQITGQPFSTPGASILVSAPGSNIQSTARLLENSNGSLFGADYETAKGTSFATPIVSGVVGLMLEANPALGWRDVQEILALSATYIEDGNTDWQENAATNWNGGGMHYSHDYGFGMVDATAAVRLAENWHLQQTSGNEVTVSYSSSASGTIPDASSYLGRSFQISEDIKVQQVDVVLDMAHDRMADLEVVLISPDGTQSLLLNRANAGAFSGTWQTTSTHFLGESSQGTWSVRIYDKQSGQSGTVQNITLNVYGRDGADDQYIYTDGFETVNASARTRIADTGGYDILNASAMSSNVLLNLAGNSTIAGRTITLASGTVIEDAYGGIGNDTIYGNEAVNTLKGGAGNDRLYARYAPGTEPAGTAVYLQGDKQVRALTSGVDILSIENPDDFYVADTTVGFIFTNGEPIATGSNHFTNFNPAQDKIDLRAVAGAIGFEDLNIRNRFTFGTITWTGISTEQGGMILLAGINASDLNASHFILNNQSFGDTLAGGLGNDVLYGSKGADVLDGGVGHDFASYRFSNAGVRIDLRDYSVGGGWATGDVLIDIERVEGSEHEDTLVGNNAPNYLYGRGGNDVIHGLAENDRLLGYGGADTLYAGQGNDTLLGGDGSDRLYAEVGNNTLYGEANNDLLYSGAGADVLDGGTGNDFASYRFSDAGVQVHLAEGTVSGGWATGDSITSIERVEGSEYKDTLTGTMASNYLYGHGGNDVIHGLDGNDRLLGYSGDDRLYAGAGNDTVYGGSGKDRIYGQAGQNRLYGKEDNDVLYSGAGADVIDGGAGSDFLSYRYSSAAVRVNLTDGTLNGGWTVGDSFTNIERAEGSEYNDTLTGDSADNYLYGRGGDDVLDGRAGNDRLLGYDGDDRYVFNEGDGQDVIEDLSGTDEIFLNAQVDSVRLERSTDTNRDLLIYYGSGNDRIRILGQFAEGTQRIEGLKLADGTTFDLTSLNLTPGNNLDFITGTHPDDGDMMPDDREDDTLIGGIGDASVVMKDNTDTPTDSGIIATFDQSGDLAIGQDSTNSFVPASDDDTDLIADSEDGMDVLPFLASNGDSLLQALS